MSKTILITGATDGIGLETARALVAEGHTVLVHGRSSSKLETAAAELATIETGKVQNVRADLSSLAETDRLADEVLAEHPQLDVIINNAGVLKAPNPATADGLDVRFMVNTIAPYRLTRRLLGHLANDGRVVNLASAAQAPVNPAAIGAAPSLDDMEAYAQSKLALIIWSRCLARELGPEGPVVVSVNPGSLLASKMVKEGFGIAGNDLGIGVDILKRAALSEEFTDATGKYFDNDAGRFEAPQQDALDDAKSARVIQAIEATIEKLTV